MEILVAGTPYEVQIVDVVDNDEYNWGVTVYATNTIQLKRSLNKDRMQEVLIHELTHALLFESGHKDHNETLAQALGKTLYLMVKENGNPNKLELPDWLEIA